MDNKQNEKLKVKGEKYKICATDFEGITLVALVITIIVLIILAAVSINAVMNDGLINNAKDAVGAYENAAKKEQTQLSTLLAELEHYDLPDVVAGGYTGTSNAKYKDANGQIAIIPAGFTVSNINSEKTISKGLVIYSGNVASTDFTTDSDSDGIVNAQENYNQYVWIPVENPSDIYGTLDSTVDGIEGYKFGKLYDFGNSTDGFVTSASETIHYNWPGEANYSSGGGREPEVLPSYSTEDSALELETEFNNMITSVEKYEGFYIGRYELTATDGVANVRKGIDPLVSTTWYGFDTACKNLESTNTDSSGKIRTTMIWGCQWDQAVKMSLADENDFLTNAKTYGVYSDSTITTQGATGRMLAAYNIYDMGGNVFEWTLEAKNNLSRAFRGGSYSTASSTSQPASFRSTSGPTGNSDIRGCRSQLYIKVD